MHKEVSVTATPFEVKLASLIEAKDAAKAIADAKDAAFEKARAESKKAWDVYDAAKDKVVKLYERKAAELTDKINLPEFTLRVITQDKVVDMFIDKNLFVHFLDDFDPRTFVDIYRFAIAYHDIWIGNRLAVYDTPEQVETVIEMLKAAVERGDTVFQFPTIDELPTA